MLIGPWNPYTDQFGLGCFSTIIAHQSMDTCHIKSKIRGSNFFYLCPQMHPRPYYVSLSNRAPVWDVWSTMLIGPWNP